MAIRSSLYAKAKGLFPKMPPEVFDLFIAPHLDAYGWPFSAANIKVHGTKWQWLFMHLDIVFWRNCDWQLESHLWSTSLFDQESKQRIAAVKINGVTGIPTITSRIMNTRERFKSCFAFIRQNQHLPAPLVCLRNGLILVILDGIHRAAALDHLQSTLSIPIWVATQASASRTTALPPSPRSRAG